MIYVLASLMPLLPCKLKVMEKHSAGKQLIQPKIVALYSLLLIVFILSGVTAHQRQTSGLSEKSDCSLKKKQATRLGNVNEMLFSIKSLSLFDIDDTSTP
jgi:hypothetical protein